MMSSLSLNSDRGLGVKEEEEETTGKTES